MTTDASPDPLPHGIAIVGLAGRFPGADNVQAFWDNLLAARETISSLRREDLAPGEPVDDPDYVLRRGVIENAEWFDAAFFGLSRIEAEVTDPQQRVFLEIAWTALEQAGYDPQRLPGVCGVWAGTGNNHYFQKQLAANADLLESAGAEAVMIGNEKDYLATRVAYRLNLRGPAINVVTACSTSLVAVAQAVHGLMTFQCDLALAGGSSIRWPQNRGYLHQEGGICSPDGHCRAFDEKSAGTVFSSGAGCVVLKRLEDAVRDGDTIYAVIRSAALNNDGAGKVSFTAPGVDGQAENITMALGLADMPAGSIDYVEAHGTGTALGDVIEVAALTQAFRASGDERIGRCGLGSLKTATGHMDAAAGVGGLIKTALALHHGVIPPTLHFHQPNPKLDLEGSPFHIIGENSEWPARPHPHRALVAALGVGGTNAHVVLEGISGQPAAESRTAPAMAATTTLIVLSARTEPALATMRENLASFLAAQHGISLADVAFTLAHGRTVFTHRASFAVSSVADAIAQLRASGPPPSTVGTAPPIAFLFPGQGSQHAGMGAELAASLPVFRQTLETCRALLGFDPLAGTDEELGQTWRTQPALFALSYALTRQYKAWGVEPAACLGHSIGEYVAATLAEVFSLEDALQVVSARGRIMQAQPHGVMLAVRCAEAELAMPDTLDLAAVNAPSLCVVSGSEEAIAAFELECETRGVGTKRLRTSHAFHSRLMDAALEEFRRAFDRVTLHPPKLRVISNLTGLDLTAEQATSPDYWVQHLRSTVRFAAGVEALKDHVLLEVGPSNVLTSLAKQAGASAVASLPPARNGGALEVASALGAVGMAWAQGGTIDWNALFPHGRRLALPTYPFQRQKYCPERIADAPRALPVESFPPAADPVPSREPVAPVAADSPMASPAGSRRDHLVRELQGQLLKISGIDVSAMPATAEFLDLGFDSLFLTQAGMALKKHFGVKITFRQLMEELTSIDALATYLDARLPPGAFGPAAAKSASGAAGAQDSTATSPPATSISGTDADSRLERIEAALAKLTGEPVSPPSSTISHPPSVFTVRVKDQKGADAKKITFGPFRPIQKATDGPLTRGQRIHLNELVAAYCARYPKSKAFTAEHRPFFADPRAVAGFNPLWKEMVFPAVTEGSEGAYLWDIDGNRWLDVVHGFGLGLFGHRPRFVVEALKNQLDRGFEIGPTSPLAGEVAGLIRDFSGQERVAFCNTGSEALMAAIRVARTVTGRDKIAMFAGSYHGIFDEVLARPLVVNGELRAIPIAPGVPESAVSQLIVLEYGHPESLEIIRRHGHELAAVLVEPVPSRRPDITPYQFVKELREITTRAGTAMIFDEVVLGFRAHPKGAQHLFGIEADLVSYGKVLGGGLPLGILAGQRKFMDALDGGEWHYGDDSAPEVGVTFFAGTFIRHPLTLAAARAVLRHLQDEGPALQQRMDAKTAAFVGRLNSVFADACVPVSVTCFSSLWMLNADPALKYFGLLFYHLRLRGLHIWEGRGNFLSTAHTDADIEEILHIFAESVRTLQNGGFLPEGGPVREMVPTDVACTATDEALIKLPRDLPSHPPAARSASRRLSPEQQELFLASKMSPEASVAAHESITLRLQGPLDVTKLGQALHQLTARHASLRTCFARDGSHQVIAPAVAIDLKRTSGSSLEEVTSAEFLEPFDLGRAPLWRTALLEHAPEDHSLVITAHHLICDGWSFGVIAHDLAVLYRGEELPPLSVPDEVRDGDPEAESYWKSEYATPPTALELPTDRPRAGQPDLRSSTLSGTLPPRLAGLLRDFCRREKLTPNAVLVTAWQILLHRLSGQSDVIVGTPVAGQLISGMTDWVGHEVHFLPLRAAVDAATGVRTLLSSTRGKLADATDHQHFTLGQLYQSLALTRAPGRPSFVTNTFTLEPAPTPLAMDDVVATILVNPKRRLAFDLSLFVVEGTEQLDWHLVYQEAIFEEETVAHWMRCFGAVVEAVIMEPEQTVGAVPLLCEEDQRLLLTEWSGILSGTTVSGTIHGLFEEQADRQPRGTALLLPSGAVTYQQLERRANQFAQELIGAGVRPGQAVALFAERSAETIAAILGILKAGGAYAPVDPAYPDERIAMMLSDLAATVFVTQPALRPRLEAILRRTAPCIVDITPDAPRLWSDRGERPTVEFSPDALAYIISTSGSTGRPKGTMVPHRAVVRLVRDQPFATISAAETWLQLAPLSFDACTLELWAPLLNGGKLALIPPGIPTLAEIGKAIRQHGVTSLFMTAGLFQLMVDERIDDLSPLRELMTGGEVVSLRHARAVLERLPHLRLSNVYGPTENTTFTTFHPITAADLAGTSLPIGRPIAKTTVYIVDDTGQPSPIGVVGELLTGGTGLALGYRRNDALTEEKFIFHPRFGRVYRTGDRVRWRAGGVIEFLGRADNQIKVRGFRIEPAEIEAALTTHPSVKQAVVIARGNSAGEKRLVAYCVETGTGFDPQALRDHLKRLLPDYMVPHSLLALPHALPLTPNGKIDISRLPDPGETASDENPSVPDQAGVAPRNEVERRLQRLMEETLGRNSFGVQDDFFALGGDSLQGLRLFTRIEREFGRALPLGTLFEAPTVEKLAQLLGGVRMDLPRHIVPIQPRGTQPPIFLIHGGDGGVLFYRKAVALLGDDQPVLGIEAPMLTDSSILTPGATVEEISRRYLDLVRQVQAQGPYRIGGYSFGGIVAYEMARQLRADDQSVEHLWLFDTDNPAVPPRYFTRTERVRARWQIDGAEGLHGPQRLQNLALRVRRGIVDRKRRHQEAVTIEKAVRSGERAPEDLRPIEVREAHMKLMEAYRPQPFQGTMTLLKCNGPNDKFEHTPALGWEGLVIGQLEVIEVTGTHLRLFEEPHVTLVAQKLAASLAGASAVASPLA